jgi:hypothetical protein
MYACVNFSCSIMLIFLLHIAPRARMFFLPCYPSNEWGSSPVGQSEISMTGRHSHGWWISLLYMAFARQMRWTGDVSIIITLNWEKHIRVVKLCMTFESGPEWIETLFWALYDLLLIQCRSTRSTKIHKIHRSTRSTEPGSPPDLTRSQLCSCAKLLTVLLYCFYRHFLIQHARAVENQ